MGDGEGGMIAFDTDWGVFMIEWSGKGVTLVRFPCDVPGTSTRRAVAPRFVDEAIEKICDHVAGRPKDMSDVPVDLGGLTDFTVRVLSALRGIPPGRTVTYGELAVIAGRPGAARAVGQAVARNPVPLLVPCHRVLASGCGLGGFSAAGGIATKKRLLKIEGVWPPVARG